jgi:uncharacterized protein
MINRDLYQQLILWKNSKNRKPLILRGARQVGKTFLLKSFGKQEYKSVIYLNFEENPKLANLFSEGLNPLVVLDNISIYTNQFIDQQDLNNTLIILDEIQEAPTALNSLKYFQEHANTIHIAAAGSLLGIQLANTKGFPVGKVNFLDLYPLTFLEFLAAIGKNKLYSFLSNSIIDPKISEPIPEPIHEQIIVLFKKYLFIGGMPEVVLEYITNKNLLTIKELQKSILAAYNLDFAKHAPKEQIIKITQIWGSIVNQLAKENKKFIFSAVRSSARAREYENAISWLVDAGLIYKAYDISTPKLPLSRYKNCNFFKIFLFDVGLLSAMSNIPAKSVIEENNNILSEFYGAFTENFVAQELFKNMQQLYYWTSAGTAEIDFIIEHNLNIYPLEVKANISRKKKSLLSYNEKYKPPLLLRTSLMNLKKDGNIYNVPLYLIGKSINWLLSH